MTAPTPTEFQEITLRILRSCWKTFERKMVVERLSGPTTANSLSVRTGQLRRSMNHIIIPRGSKGVRLNVFVGGGVPYARIHEKGGTIRPKKSKYLAIPVGQQLTGAGVSKGGPRQSADPLMFILSKLTKKKLLVAAKQVPRKRGSGTRLTPDLKGGKLDVRFVLVDKVTIKPRLGFKKTFNIVAKECIRKLRRRGRKIRVPR